MIVIKNLFSIGGSESMKSVSVKLMLAILGVTILSSFALASSSEWIIKKDSWSATDEKNYSAFIQALGESGCNSVTKCLKSPANPYRASDPSDYGFQSDCGKFPYLLRSYFAWKNGLPFSYATGVQSNDPGTRDIRYSPHGNHVTSRRAIVQRGGPINGLSAVRTVAAETFTAMFRVNPSKDDPNGQWSDFYSPSIVRTQIKPGSIVYDADGHVVVIYKVESDGRVKYFDAHPDNSVTHGTYGKKFARTGLGQGGGFKNFRPLILVGASRGSRGEYVGGQIKTVANSQIAGFSIEQYVPGRRGSSGAEFEVGGEWMSFQDFVRARLAGTLKYHPLEELSNGIEALCGDLTDRVTAVQTSLDAGIQNKSHPANLPTNIYGTDGEWETYSSPSRDARLKTSMQELLEHVTEMVKLYEQRSQRIDYTGANLPNDLRATYQKAADSCQISYKKTNGTQQPLDYDAAVKRVFKMSFDPYHCAEMRWGADTAQEMQSCDSRGEKISWYKAEQRLRNQIERQYSVRMGFSLSELQAGGPGTGVDKAPNVDLRSYLETLQ